MKLPQSMAFAHKQSKFRLADFSLATEQVVLMDALDVGSSQIKICRFSIINLKTWAIQKKPKSD